MLERAATRTSNIRTELSSFVGRAVEIEELGATLQRRRLVSIVGPGGVGKTRLATELAARWNPPQSAGAWMLELGAATGSDDVARTLLTCFGGHAAPANGPVDVLTASEVIAGAIGEATVLLVLDNCEHVLADARSTTSALLARCPNLHILTTSRVVLAVPGELVRQLHPLALDDAVRLFAERGVDAVNGFAIDPDSEESVRSICEHVDRLPLGVELAAARLRAFSPVQLAGRLSAIGGSGEGRTDRHRTLPATVAWSYDLLFDHERVLLRTLSAFHGTFALDAVEDLTADGALADADIADSLARLVDKSLVVADRTGPDPRFRLLRTVADFAANAAADHGEIHGLRRRHAEWVGRLAAAGSVEIRGPNQDAWAQRLRHEAPNIAAALAFARTDDVALGLRIGADLAWFALTSTALPTARDDLLALLAVDGAGSSMPRGERSRGRRCSLLACPIRRRWQPTPSRSPARSVMRPRSPKRSS